MGNCWPKPVDTLPAGTTSTPSPGNNKGFKQSPNNRNVAGSNYNPKSSPVVHHQQHRQDEQSLKVQSVHVHVQAAAAAPPLSPLSPPPPPTAAANNTSPSSTSAAGSGSSNGSPRNMKKFSYAELRTATRNFRPDTVLGEGGFGRVFKGWIDEKMYAPSKVGVGI